MPDREEMDPDGKGRKGMGEGRRWGEAVRGIYYMRKETIIIKGTID